MTVNYYYIDVLGGHFPGIELAPCMTVNKLQFYISIIVLFAKSIKVSV